MQSCLSIKRRATVTSAYSSVMNNVVRPARQQLGRTSIHQRQASLITAAASLFATIGFRGTTTKPIALAAGVSKALLFKHFLPSTLCTRPFYLRRLITPDYRNRWKRPQRNQKISDSSCCCQLSNQKGSRPNIVSSTPVQWVRRPCDVGYAFLATVSSIS